MFTVVGKYFHAEVVQDDPEFDLPVGAVYQASSLMDDGPSGTGEFPVDLEDRFVRTEAQRRMACAVLCEADCEFAVHLVCVAPGFPPDG